MATPQALATISAESGKTIVFYVDSGEKTIAFRASREEPEKATGARSYDQDFISAYSSTAKTGQKSRVTFGGNDLCALTYKFGGTGNTNAVYSIRLFYQDQNNVIQELCQDGGGDWYIGTLGTGSSKPVATSTTALTCHVSTVGNDRYLKVFFYDTVSGSPRLGVAWTKLGAAASSENWQVKAQI